MYVGGFCIHIIRVISSQNKIAEVVPPLSGGINSIGSICPRGGIGIRAALSTLSPKGLEVQILSRAQFIT